MMMKKWTERSWGRLFSMTLRRGACSTGTLLILFCELIIFMGTIDKTTFLHLFARTWMLAGKL